MPCCYGEGSFARGVLAKPATVLQQSAELNMEGGYSPLFPKETTSRTSSSTSLQQLEWYLKD